MHKQLLAVILPVAGLCALWFAGRDIVQGSVLTLLMKSQGQKFISVTLFADEKKLANEEKNLAGGFVLFQLEHLHQTNPPAQIFPSNPPATRPNYNLQTASSTHQTISPDPLSSSSRPDPPSTRPSLTTAASGTRTLSAAPASLPTEGFSTSVMSIKYCGPRDYPNLPANVPRHQEEISINKLLEEILKELKNSKIRGEDFKNKKSHVLIQRIS